MDLNELLLTAVRATFVYFYLLVIVRILGKREIGATSAFDLVVALMLGDVVDEVIYGDVTIALGAVAMAVIGAWHIINAFASFKMGLFPGGKIPAQGRIRLQRELSSVCRCYLITIDRRFSG